MLFKWILDAGRRNGCRLVDRKLLELCCNWEEIRCADKETLGHSENSCESRSHSEDSKKIQATKLKY